MRGKIMTKSTASTSIAAIDTFALSRGYATKAHAKRARDAFCVKHKLSVADFVLSLIDKLHHFKRVSTSTTVTKAEAAETAQQLQQSLRAVPDSHSPQSPGYLAPKSTRAEAAAVAAAAPSLPNALDKITTGPTSPAPKCVPADLKLAVDTVSTDANGVPNCLKINPADRKAAWASQP